MNNIIIEFTVYNRPPKKNEAKSVWSSNQAKLVLDLRLAAYDAFLKAKLHEPFDGAVELELTIYAPNIINIGNHTYVGDLDSFVAGISESLHVADSQVTPDEIFKGHEEVYPTRPIIINNDSQIVSIIAKKVESDKLYYHVSVRPITNN